MNDFYDRIERCRLEREEPTIPLCYHCGAECSGDTTETIDIDGMLGEVCICDESCCGN